MEFVSNGMGGNFVGSEGEHFSIDEGAAAGDDFTDLLGTETAFDLAGEFGSVAKPHVVIPGVIGERFLNELDDLRVGLAATMETAVEPLTEHWIDLLRVWEKSRERKGRES